MKENMDIAGFSNEPAEIGSHGEVLADQCNDFVRTVPISVRRTVYEVRVIEAWCPVSMAKLAKHSTQKDNNPCAIFQYKTVQCLNFLGMMNH